MKYVIDPEVKQPRLDLFDGFTYSTVDTFDGKKDLQMMIMEDSTIGKPFGYKPPVKPCVLWVMGGAWLECPREKAIPFLVQIARAGYVVASATYRTSKEAIWPAQIIDVQTAVRYLRAHAEQHSIDPDRIAIMGLSAGGHLTAMAAQNPDYPRAEWAEFSADVQCAVDMFGPADMAKLVEDKEISAIPSQMPPFPGGPLPPAEYALVGGTTEEKPEAMRDASPIYHIGDKTCPMLIMHGVEDAVVSVRQSERLYEMLQAAGKEADLYLLEHTGHGYSQFFQEDVVQIMIDFLDKHLK